MNTTNENTSSAADTQAATPRPNYRIYDRTGGGVTHDIYAETLEAAIEAGREWIEDGDWSCRDDEEGTTYRTIALECQVGEIIYRRDVRSIESLPAVYAVTVASDESLAIEVDGDELPVLLPLLSMLQITGQSDRAEDGTVILMARLGRSLPQMIDEDATHDAQRHYCSGTYSDVLPDCEVDQTLSDFLDNPSTRDEEGHIWESPYEVVGGIKENPGMWSGGGTRMNFREVCRLCGKYRDTTDPGCQRNHDEPMATITIHDRDDKSAAWIKEQHADDDGFIPDWLSEMLDCSTRG